MSVSQLRSSDKKTLKQTYGRFGRSESDIEKVFELELPQKGMKDQWLYIFYKQYSNFNTLLTNLEDVTDKRVLFMVKDIISTIPDEKARREMLDTWKQRLEERLEEAKRVNGGVLSNEKEASIAIDVALEVKGLVTDWVDQFMGVTHKLAVGMP